MKRAKKLCTRCSAIILSSWYLFSTRRERAFMSAGEPNVTSDSKSLALERVVIGPLCMTLEPSPLKKALRSAGRHSVRNLVDVPRLICAASESIR